MSRAVFRRKIAEGAEHVTVTSFDDGRVELKIDSLVGPVARTISAHFAARLSRLIADAAKFSNPQSEKESSENDEPPKSA